MSNVKEQYSEEINLADLFYDIYKGWYFFVIGVILSIILSLSYFSLQKEEIEFSVDIKNIDDVKKNLLPESIFSFDLLSFFRYSSISEENIKSSIKNKDNYIFEEIDLNVNKILSQISISNNPTHNTLNLTISYNGEINKKKLIDEAKILLSLILKSRRSSSFKELENNLTTEEQNLNRLLSDENTFFINNISKKNHDIDKILFNDLGMLNLIYDDLNRKIANNLLLARELNIIEPVFLSFEQTQKISSLPSVVSKVDQLESELLSIITIGEYPLYNYGVKVLEEEMKLLKQQKDNFKNVISNSINMINKEINLLDKFEYTEVNMKLMKKLSKIKREKTQLQELYDTGFNIVAYDINAIKTIENKKSLIAILIFFSAIILVTTFVLNFFYQVSKNRV